MIRYFDLRNPFYYSIFEGNSLKLRNASTGQTKSFDSPAQEYTHNSYGYRGKDFSSSYEVLTAGCSYTYGVGVPQDAVWWSQVVSKFGLETSAPIAKPGASIAWIVEKLFAYFAEFGHPKYLLCLFPDTFRTVVPLDGVVLTADVVSGDFVGESGSFGAKTQRLYTHHVVNENTEEKLKYSKRPHHLKDVYTVEITTFEAVRAIRFLEQYCLAVGIKLYWTTWDHSFAQHLREVNKIEGLRFKCFFDLGFYNYRQSPPEAKDVIFYGDYDINAPTLGNCTVDCYKELKDLYGEKNYNLGTDTSRGEEKAHPGTHLHAHYAESFIQQLMLEYPHEFK